MTDWKDEQNKIRRFRNLVDDEDIIPTKKKSTKKKPKKKLKNSCKALECLICTLRFPAESVLNGSYNIETFVCSYCCAEMQQKPHEQSCFGKPTFIQLTGKRDLGYDPIARDCKDICPDRIICQRVVRPDLAGLDGIV